MAVDLRALYQFDMIAALRGDSSSEITMTYLLIDRLQHEPMSHFRAEIAGDDRFIGWGPLENIAAALYNALAARNKGKKLSNKEMYPVPQIKKKHNTRRPKSVKDINWAAMLGGVK